MSANPFLYMWANLVYMKKANLSCIWEKKNNLQDFFCYCHVFALVAWIIRAPSQLKLVEYFLNWLFPKFLNPIKLKNKCYWFFAHMLVVISYSLTVIIYWLQYCIKIGKKTLVLWRYCTFVPPFFIDDSGAEFHAD